MSMEFYLLVPHVLWTGFYDGLIDVFSKALVMGLFGMLFHLDREKGFVVNKVTLSKRDGIIFELSLKFSSGSDLEIRNVLD